MKSIRTVALGVALVAGLATVGEAQAQQGERGKGHDHPRAGAEARGEHGKAGRGKHGDRMGPRAFRGQPGARAYHAALRGIELTEDQKARIREVRQQHRQELTERRKALRAQWGEGTRPDSAQRAAMRTGMRAMAERERDAVRAVLTPEQQRTFDANLAEMRRRMEAHQAERRREAGSRR